MGFFKNIGKGLHNIAKIAGDSGKTFANSLVDNPVENLLTSGIYAGVKTSIGAVKTTKDLYSSPSEPEPAPVALDTTSEYDAEKAKQAEELKRRRQGSGRSSTILTSRNDQPSILG